jgi:ketosteroid isomerase-like protein
MSEENVKTVQQAYEGANDRLEFPKELFDPDWELDVTEVSPEDVAVVRVTTREAFREYWEMFERFHIELEEVIHADEEQVVTAVRDSGRMRGSDAEVSNRFFHVWGFSDGKIIRMSVHADRNRALEILGLSE